MVVHPSLPYPALCAMTVESRPEDTDPSAVVFIFTSCAVYLLAKSSRQKRVALDHLNQQLLLGPSVVVGNGTFLSPT